jgi:hypothetical protein
MNADEPINIPGDLEAEFDCYVFHEGAVSLVRRLRGDFLRVVGTAGVGLR